MAWLLNRRMIRSMATMAALLVGACDNAAMYKCDGKLFENGIFAAKDGYVLDLGALPLATNGARSFEIGILPAESFVVGLELTGTSKVPS